MPWRRDGCYITHCNGTYRRPNDVKRAFLTMPGMKWRMNTLLSDLSKSKYRRQLKCLGSFDIGTENSENTSVGIKCIPKGIWFAVLLVGRRRILPYLTRRSEFPFRSARGSWCLAPGECDVTANHHPSTALLLALLSLLCQSVNNNSVGCIADFGCVLLHSAKDNKITNRLLQHVAWLKGETHFMMQDSRHDGCKNRLFSGEI